MESYLESTDPKKQLTHDKTGTQLKKTEEDKLLTYTLLRLSDKMIYNSLLKTWSTEFAQSRDQYLIGLEEAEDAMAQHLMRNSGK